MSDIKTPNSNTKEKKPIIQKVALVFIVVVGIAAFYYFDGMQYLSVTSFRNWVEQQPFIASIGYLLIYILVCSLPVAGLLTIIGGAVFGFWWALPLVSFGSTIGSTLSFLLSRWLLRDWVQNKFEKYLAAVNKGVKEEGAFYLFSMRLIPLFPPAAINLMFGLTPMKTWTFYWVSQLGMFAGTIVYVNVGAQVGNLGEQLGGEEISASGILTPELIFAFVLLGIFPLVVKKVMALVQARFGNKKSATDAA